jgi:phosphatidylethanolamine-binding protein (PEBP) family uncharacterized protein
MMRFVICAAALLFLSQPAFAEFRLSFDWGNIPACNTGKPNRVGSPAFVLKGLPEGTTVVEFKLTDLDVPNYKHGGGKVKVRADGKLPFGAFKYKSPCPPGEVHTYQWTATAKKGRKTLATAAARRKYPE